MQDKIFVVIEGLSPLLMNRFPMEPIEGIQKMTPMQQAECAAYRQSNSGELYIPATALWRAIVDGATYVKGKGRSSLQKVAAACVLIEPEYLLLGTKDYSLDSRRVVVSATKGAIIRHRPRLDKWRVAFSITYDATLLSVVDVRQIVDNAGSRVGVLDFRPARKGPFGRFQVVKWQIEMK